MGLLLAGGCGQRQTASPSRRQQESSSNRLGVAILVGRGGICKDKSQPRSGIPRKKHLKKRQQL